MTNHQLNVRAALLHYLQLQTRSVHRNTIADHFLKNLPYWKSVMSLRIDNCRLDIDAVESKRIQRRGRNLGWYCYIPEGHTNCQHPECIMNTVHQA